MRDMHTVRESVGLDDMVRTTELLLEIIRVHTIGIGEGGGCADRGRRLEG